MDKKQRFLVICGLTATGKTKLGMKIAKKFNGEIISADSRQVYKGMDIGTGKDLPIVKRFHLVQGGTLTKNEKLQIGYYIINHVKIWLYDLVKPDYQFSVADYVKCANLVIEDIYKRGKLPIIVGGTGLYIKGLIDGIGTLGIEPDWELRKRLANCSIAQLSDKLKKLNPEKWQSMNHSDRNNSRRLARAIEVAMTKEKKSSALYYCHSTIGQENVFFVGLTASYKTLYQRIDERVAKRVKQGVEEEIKKLLDAGYNFENSAMGTTIGYKEWKEYFCHPEFISGSDPALGGMTKEMLKQVQHDGFINIIQCWKFAEHAYARRQMTWFRKDKRIKWFEIGQKDFILKIVKLTNKWYNP